MQANNTAQQRALSLHEQHTQVILSLGRAGDRGEGTFLVIFLRGKWVGCGVDSSLAERIEWRRCRLGGLPSHGQPMAELWPGRLTSSQRSLSSALRRTWGFEKPVRDPVSLPSHNPAMRWQASQPAPACAPHASQHNLQTNMSSFWVLKTPVAAPPPFC
jgi:hypothetical protein